MSFPYKDQPVKTCIKCRTGYPNTSEYFVKNHHNQSELTELCMRCARKEKTKIKEKIREMVPNLMERLQQFSVDFINEGACADSNNLPHSAELVEAIMRAFGGVENFGKLYALHFFQAEAGKAQRTRMLQAITALVIQNVDQGGAKKPLDLWTEDEINAEIDRRIQEKSNQQLRIVGPLIDAG